MPGTHAEIPSPAEVSGRVQSLTKAQYLRHKYPERLRSFLPPRN